MGLTSVLDNVPNAQVVTFDIADETGRLLKTLLGQRRKFGCKLRKHLSGDSCPGRSYRARRYCRRYYVALQIQGGNFASTLPVSRRLCQNLAKTGKVTAKHG